MSEPNIEIRLESIDQDQEAGRRPGRRATTELVWYVVSILVVSLVIAVAAPNVSPVVLGIGLALVLSAIGWTFIHRRQREAAEAHHRELARALDRTRRDYKGLFSVVPCFICVQDRNHRIIEANELYRTEFGADYGSLCYEVCKKRNLKCPDCLVERTFADGRVHSNEEVLVTRNGTRINAIVHTRPVYDDAGKIRAVMEVFTDITEVKALQRQLTLMGRAVAGMAHRVKNILMGLEGGIFVVNSGIEEDDREAIAEGWEMVERNVNRVSRIVKDLLYCSKDRIPKFEEDVCPNDILLDVVNLFEDRLAEEGITLRTELCEPPQCGTFDPEGLHNLLCNLVANAVDACRFDPSDTKNGHTITLRCRSNGESSTILEVEDDGSGIPDEMNNRVFEDFFSTKGSEGTGIGLLVVQQVAQEHGGTITFTTRPGEGTIFTATLPTSASPAPLGKLDPARRTRQPSPAD